MSGYLLHPPARPTGDDTTRLAGRLDVSNAGVFLDGERLPWHLLREPIEVEMIDAEAIPDGWQVAYLPIIITDGVHASDGVLVTELDAPVPPADG